MNNLNPLTPTPDEIGHFPDHTSAADLQMMADAMLKLEGADLAFFASELIVKRLMQYASDNDAANQVLEIARETGLLVPTLSMLFTMDPESPVELVKAAAHHCVSGADTTGPTSAGGWNKEEVMSAYASLYVARKGLSVPFGANVQ